MRYPAPHAFLLILSLSISAAAQAEDAKLIHLNNAQEMYTCGRFLHTMADSASDPETKKKVNAKAMAFDAVATVEATEMTPNAPPDKAILLMMSLAARKQVNEFYTKIGPLPQDEVNAQLAQFWEKCNKDGAQIGKK